jgi:hypothetical protein
MVERGYIIAFVAVYPCSFGTSVVLLRCQFVTEIMHGRSPEVFLHQ